MKGEGRWGLGFLTDESRGPPHIHASGRAFKTSDFDEGEELVEGTLRRMNLGVGTEQQALDAEEAFPRHHKVYRMPV